MSGRCALLVAVLVAVAAGRSAAAAGAEEEHHDFASVKRALRVKARSRRPEERIEVIGQLERYPEAESARWIVQIGFGSRDPGVRRAACAALRKLNDSPDVCETLLGRLRQETRHPDLDVASAIIAVLLASERHEVQGELIDWLDGHLATSRTAPLLVSMVVTSLADQGDAEAVASLGKLTELRYFTGNFGFRRGLVQALIAVGQPEAVEAIIDLLGSLRGEERADIVNYLSALSGENHGVDAGAWSQWWRDNRQRVVLPMRAPPAPRAGAAGAAADYYGIPIYALRMVFVVDTSGSMAGARLAAAKRELIQAIDGLRPEAWFDIIVFSSTASPWQPRLVLATPANKRAAAGFVATLTAGGMTASYDAIEMAFRRDIEAIYFVSDGAPSAGKIVDPRGIVAFVSAANRFRRVSIYTIGIMPGPPGNPLSTFMECLASQNFGVYQQVDN